jgi:hypothetical protein
MYRKQVVPEMGPSRKLHTASANSGVQDERALAAMKELKTAIVVKPHKKKEFERNRKVHQARNG